MPPEKAEAAEGGSGSSHGSDIALLLQGVPPESVMAAMLAGGPGAIAEEVMSLAAKWHTRAGAAELAWQLGPDAVASLAGWARVAEAQHVLDCFTRSGLKYALDTKQTACCACTAVLFTFPHASDCQAGNCNWAVLNVPPSQHAQLMGVMDVSFLIRIQIPGCSPQMNRCAHLSLKGQAGKCS